MTGCWIFTSSLSWRLIWTWHPVLEAFGHNKNANSSYSLDPWFYPTELLDNQKEVSNSFLQKLRTTKIMSSSIPYRLIVFHHTSKPRNKMINLLTSKLALPGHSTYFLFLKNRQPGDPLPTIPDWVNDTCARKLHNALLVLLKHRPPNDIASWKTYVETHTTSPTRPPFLSVFLSACLPWSSSCFSSAAGPARRGQIQSDPAMLRFPWLVEWSQPWLSSRPGLAAEYESEAPCWWTWSITISLSSTTQER